MVLSISVPNYISHLYKFNKYEIVYRNEIYVDKFKFSMVVGIYTHLDEMLASQYQLIDLTQNTSCKLQATFQLREPFWLLEP